MLQENSTYPSNGRVNKFLQEENRKITHNLIKENKWGEWLVDTFMEDSISFYPYKLVKDQIFLEILEDSVCHLSPDDLENLKLQALKSLSEIKIYDFKNVYDLVEILYHSRVVFKDEKIRWIEAFISFLPSYLPERNFVTVNNKDDIDLLLTIIAESIFVYVKEKIEDGNDLDIQNNLEIIYCNLFDKTKLLENPKDADSLNLYFIYYSYFLKFLLNYKKWLTVVIDFLDWANNFDSNNQYSPDSQYEDLKAWGEMLITEKIFEIVTSFNQEEIISTERINKDLSEYFSNPQFREKHYDIFKKHLGENEKFTHIFQD